MRTIVAFLSLLVLLGVPARAHAHNFLGAVEPPPSRKMFTSGCAGFSVPWFAGFARRSYWIGFQMDGGNGTPAQLVQAVVANSFGGNTAYAFGEHNSPLDDEQGTRIQVYPGDYVYECLVMTGITWDGHVTWYTEIDDYTTGQSTTFTHTVGENASVVKFFVNEEWEDNSEPCGNLDYNASTPYVGWDSIVLTVGDYTANYIQYINWPWDGQSLQASSFDSSPIQPNCSYYTYSVSQGEVIAN